MWRPSFFDLRQCVSQDKSVRRLHRDWFGRCCGICETSCMSSGDWACPPLHLARTCRLYDTRHPCGTCDASRTFFVIQTQHGSHGRLQVFGTVGVASGGLHELEPIENISSIGPGCCISSSWSDSGPSKNRRVRKVFSARLVLGGASDMLASYRQCWCRWRTRFKRRRTLFRQLLSGTVKTRIHLTCGTLTETKR